jgi:hypothetical protein
MHAPRNIRAVVVCIAQANVLRVKLNHAERGALFLRQIANNSEGSSPNNMHDQPRHKVQNRQFRMCRGKDRSGWCANGADAPKYSLARCDTCHEVGAQCNAFRFIVSRQHGGCARHHPTHPAHLPVSHLGFRAEGLGCGCTSLSYPPPPLP